MFVALELHKYRETPHLHALVANVEPVNRSNWWKVWYQTNGRARIEPYDPDRGAAWYITKYVGKESIETGEWDLWGTDVLTQKPFAS